MFRPGSLMFLGRRLRHMGTGENVTCSEQQDAAWFTGSGYRGSNLRLHNTAGLPWIVLAIFFK